MNQILHAHPHAVEPASIGLQAWVARNALVLSLSDDGIAFDPLSRPVPSRRPARDDARPGWLGLRLQRGCARADL